jgi:hypothetical protein
MGSDTVERHLSRPASPPIANPLETAMSAVSLRSAPDLAEIQNATREIAIRFRLRPHISRLAHAWKINADRRETGRSTFTEQQLRAMSEKAATLPMSSKTGTPENSTQHLTGVAWKQHPDGTYIFHYNDGAKLAVYSDHTHIAVSPEGLYQITWSGEHIHSIVAAFNKKPGIYLHYPLTENHQNLRPVVTYNHAEPQGIQH